MMLLLQATEGAPYLSTLLLLGGLGFVAAVIIGSIAWYNSKRPAGWEDKERPDIVPEVKK
ncbi:hypothetical protein [Nodosilinea sp. P-1105]|uniref:photosystem II assembly protein Psb35 n=1 Tax=Nodosilinea sp. P-1105 TaxID=2546229 RepID=UPI00146EBE90|nr:hypothetical protein [Nodosilinea sp. P-1105]NMF83914.1 hypothetical protein [Nodosilinea sp. P-1105]